MGRLAELRGLVRFPKGRSFRSQDACYGIKSGHAAATPGTVSQAGRGSRSCGRQAQRPHGEGSLGRFGRVVDADGERNFPRKQKRRQAQARQGNEILARILKTDAADGVPLREVLVRSCRPTLSSFSQWIGKRRAAPHPHRGRPSSQPPLSPCGNCPSVRACNQNACPCPTQPPVLPVEIEHLLPGENQATTKQEERAIRHISGGPLIEVPSITM